MEKRIKKEIRSYIIQIIVICLFVVGSYFVFTNSRIAEFASTAAYYDTNNVDLMVSYKQDSASVLSTENILDKGTLSVKNPNKRNVSSTIYLYISEDANIDTIDFLIDGNKIDTTNKVIEDGYYVFSVLNCDIPAFEYKYIDTEVQGDAFFTAPFSYKFNVESF